MQRLLAVIPQTPIGLRDRALILTLVLTGRRRAEVFDLKAGDLATENGRIHYAYRGKGGKSGRRELPLPAVNAIRAWLAASGRSLEAMKTDEPLWPNLRTGRAITSGVFYTNLRRYLAKAGPLAGSPACTSFDTARPSYAVTRESQSRRSRASWTTAAWL